MIITAKTSVNIPCARYLIATTTKKLREWKKLWGGGRSWLNSSFVCMSLRQPLWRSTLVNFQTEGDKESSRSNNQTLHSDHLTHCFLHFFTSFSRNRNVMMKKESKTCTPVNMSWMHHFFDFSRRFAIDQKHLTN
jgi:hypothetical protein